MSQTVNHRGRCLEKTGASVLLSTEQGSVLVPFAQGDCRVGDIVEVRNGVLKTLTPNRSQSQKWTERVLNPRRIKALKMRELIEAGIEYFFKVQGFHKTRTPLLVRSPGMEPHIRPYQLSTGEFIPTSPEFAMKKLLVGGLEKIFQICPAFRYEPTSTQHHPEFTILEWYRAYAGYDDIMIDFEKLIESLAIEIFGKPEIEFQGQKINVQTPWPRLKVRALFQDFTKIDLVACSTIDRLAAEARRLGLDVGPDDSWDDLYFKIWLDHIEPRLPRDKAVFVCRYPASQSALSVIDEDSDGSRWARRFEPYAGGLELGNAFEELTDPVEQRKRFDADMALRREVHGDAFPVSPIDEDFIGALKEGMPPSGGIAVGVDRLVMLFANEPDIDFTLWLPSYVHQK